MRLRNFVVVALFVLAGAGMARAQGGTTGTIKGLVVDPQGLAVPGATVTATGDQGVKSAVTDSEGRFNVPFLTPGIYGVRAELQGFKAVEQKNVQVRLSQTVELSLIMEVGGIAETIEVAASSPVVDMTSTTVGATLDAELLQHVPVGRRFSDTLYLAPGVTSSASAGRSNPSISGGSGLDNQYVVDGVNITNAGYGALGSYSIVFGSLGNGTPFDFVKEVQVKSGGYEAEYGQSWGGVVNVITKSGSNNLAGTAFGYIRSDALEASFKQYQSINGTVNTTGTTLGDAGIEIGGPIIRDRIFFHAAVDPSWETRSLIAPDDEANFPLRALGSVDRKRKIISYSAKGTVQLTSNHRFDASFFGDPGTGANGPQRTSSLLNQTTSAFSKLEKIGGNNQTVRYDGVMNSRWLVEASFARARNIIEEVPSVDEWFVSDFTVTPTVVTGGIGFFEQGNDGKNFQYQAKSTHIFGGHQVRYGVLFEDIAYDQVNNRTGPTIVLPNGQETVTGASVQIRSDPTFGRIYRVSRANLNLSRHTTQQYFNFFVQDTWKVGNRLTIKPGVRYEQQQIVGTLDDFTLDGNWGARIGGTYDPTGTGRSKVYANWGRYYAKIPNDLAARALSSDAGVSRADYFDAALTRPVPEGTLALDTTSHFTLLGVGADLIDPNVKSSYTDEAVAGFEFEAAPSLNVGVRYIHRSIPRVLEDIGQYSVVGCDFNGEGCAFDYVLTNPSPSTPVLDSFSGATFEKAVHKYDAVEFTADKRFANNWSLQASYSWSRLNGTFEGFYREDNGQSDPGITALYDFPTNDPSYTSIGVPQFGYKGDIRFLGNLGRGPLPLDRPHKIKAFGNYSFDMGVNLGVGLLMNSGRPLTALAANPNYTNGGEIPLTPRGAGIDTQDGFRERTPFEFDLSLHADYALRFGGARRLVLVADAFNLLNIRRIIDYDNWVELELGVPNPDFGAPISQNVAGAMYQPPFQLRLGARFEF